MSKMIQKLKWAKLMFKIQWNFQYFIFEYLNVIKRVYDGWKEAFRVSVLLFIPVFIIMIVFTIGILVFPICHLISTPIWYSFKQERPVNSDRIKQVLTEY